MTYAAPLRDIRFVLDHLIGAEHIAALPDCAHVNAELVSAVLEEAGRFAAGVLAPLNAPGDHAGARWDNGVVRTPHGFAVAYRRFVEAGWNALSCDPAHGGQGLPLVVAAGVEEMWHASNMAFGLCPLLTRGAIEAITLVGTDAQKESFLPKLVEGVWTGTMNLTEPQAGSDLAAVRTRAVPDRQGGYSITGQKIYITYGEHDMAENIVHLVLARLPDAPEGVKGISLFVVPKFIPDAQGRPTTRNDVRCVSIEHKLGIHASPTAVLAFGDNGGAYGELLGEANRGLEYMFIMMNNARFQVGLQGMAIADRAFQQARAYARERVQGTEAGVRGGAKVAIIKHPDVRRMLMEMKARTEAMRALCLVAAHALDLAHGGDRAAQARADLLIPVVKGWCTEQAIDVTSIGIQVHGGMGFIEDTGAAQHLRDARITTIYEGTTGIQANDLIGRKVARDCGRAAHALLAEMRETAELVPAEGELASLRAGLLSSISLLGACVDWVAATFATDPAAASAGAVPFLKLFGTVAGGWQTARGALAARARLAAADTADRDFLRAKLGTARFYADHVLVQANQYAHAVLHGAAATMALTEDQLAA